MSVPVFGMSHRDFTAALKKTRLAIIPVGSLEQHGSHLPVSTDSLIAEYIARLAAEEVGAFVLPVISYGVSFEHKPMFNVSLRNSTLSTMICDACVSLAENRITRIIILNGHHGNMGALQYIAQELHGRLPRGVGVHTIHYWHMMKSEFDHAGEVETSLVLAIAPDLVRMDLAVPNSKKLSKSKAAYSSITNAPGSFPKITGNGVWGDPRKATAAKGEKWIQEIVAGLAKTMTELA
ncbi:MAG TPA: creatininase family protein [Nitrososphaera sp.]|nr:creatininase family protein [Nitrososphaera sp.]